MKAFLNERIHLNGGDWIPTSSDDFNVNINSLLETLNSFLFLEDVDVYYSSIEINRLFSNINNLEEISDYSITNPVHRIRQLLIEIESNDWSINKIHKDNHRYYYLYNLGAQTEYVNNTSLAEACEYKHNQEKVFLINFHSSEFNATPNIHISRANINPPYDINSHNLDCLVNMVQCISWYHDNRPERTYTWNKKHGENGKGVLANKGEVVSPLECTRQEAESFLSIALGYRKSNELYNFDPQNGKFMVWKCDAHGTYSFHAYHPINQDEIDVKVKQFLNKLIV
jgi:hypothetical protein